MSRQNKLYIWLAGILAVPVLIYASSPWLIAGLIKQNLSDWDLSVTRIHVGYPGWRTLRLHQLEVSTIVGAQQISLQLNDTDVGYRVADALAGYLARVHVTTAIGRVQPATATASTAGTISVLPLGAMVSGQWLSQIPVREVQVDRLTVDGRTASDATYTIRLKSELGDTGLQASGEIDLPKPTQVPLSVSFSAQKTGEARLLLTSPNATRPIFDGVVNKVVAEKDQINASGSVHATFQPLAPVLGLVLTDGDWLAELEGEFDCQWQAVVATATGDTTLALKQLQGKGINWDVAGEASLFVGSGGGNELPLDLQLIRLAGRYKETSITGLSAKAAMAIGAGLRTTKDAQLSVALLDVGLPIENIASRFQLAPHAKSAMPVVQVKKLAAELLGGKAYARPFKLDLGREKNRFLVQLDGVGLNNIMQLEQQAELQGTGVLDGQIPVEITRNGIQVAQGKLSARAPGGKIRYVPTQTVLTLAKTNPGVKLVVDALTDFQYHKLDVVADYKPEGNLLLKVSLEGKNPTWQSGRPVNLNLNLEENIPALLRSLQLSGEITERVRKHYQDKP